MGFPSGYHRFLYDNPLTADNATPSEVASGRITQVLKDVAVGGAVGQPGGLYTGLTEQQWAVEIDSVAGGTAVGLATFRYSRDGGTTWEASGVLTSTSPVSLAAGVTFVWTAAATGADFAVGDRWLFKTLLPYALDAALDYQDRNRVYRSSDASGTKTIDVDFGAETLVRVLSLLDHNLTSGATVTVKGNSVPADWGAPAVSETVTWTVTAIVAFLTTGAGTYRYWRIEIADAANPDGRIEFSTLFLGDYLELATRKLSNVPWDETRVPARIRSESQRGYRRESIESLAADFPLHYGFLSASEYDTLATLRDTAWDATTKRHNPLIFVPGSSAPSTVYLCWLEDFTLTGQYPTGYAGDVHLREVVKL